MRLTSKAILIAALLVVVSRAHFAFWSVALAVGAMFAVYFSEFEDRQLFKTSFFFLFAIGLLGARGLSFADLPQWVVPSLAAIWGIFLFLLLGITELIFAERELMYRFFHTGLLLFLASFFSVALFHSLESWFLQIISLAAAVFTFFLVSREYFRFSGVSWARRVRLASLLTSLVGVEFLWFLSFLPLGAVRSGVFLTLVLVAMRDLAVASLRGTITRRLIFGGIAVFSAFFLLVFALTLWLP